METGREPTKRIHVASHGNDAGTGSEATPFATIRRAVRDAEPGTAIMIHEGVYAGNVSISSLRGTPEAPIWIGGVEGEAAPRFAAGSAGLHLRQVSYLILHDIEVANSEQNGINVDDGRQVADPEATHHLVFRNLHVHDIGGDGNQDCLKLSGVNRFWVLDSRFERCGGRGQGSGIDAVGTHDGMVLGNTFRDMSANAVQFKGGSERVEIRANRVSNGGERAFNLGGTTGDAFFRPPLSAERPNFEARDILAIANVIEGSNAAIAFVGCLECRAAHNTIIDPKRWIFRILQEHRSHDDFELVPARAGHVANNLIYFRRGGLGPVVNIGADTEPNTFSWHNNLFYAWDEPSQSRPTLPGVEAGTIVGEDPDLGPDFDIDLSSPAAGAGLRLEGISRDANGACYRDPPSIGAFEAVP